ncbi:MAG: hypothetical protein KGQ41_07960 [Alphaproteobacteria bacterium]|nr:hypothetical protein [Alphaproteobacteria bacterium]
MAPSNSLEGREILIEIIPLGAYVKVNAFDTASMTEVTIQGPKTAAQSVLRNNAIRRLEYVLRKKGIIE